MLRNTFATLIAAALTLTAYAQELRLAPRQDARPVNQLKIAGNACGPAAVLNSFRFGNDKWSHSISLVPGREDRELLSQWIRRYGLRPSSNLRNKPRWSAQGINAEDLVFAVNEMTRGLNAQRLAYETLVLGKKETDYKLLLRTHDRLDESLDEGVPPILNLQRFVYRRGNWQLLQSHYITIIGVQKKVSRRDHEFRISYIDPWGGVRRDGKIRMPSHQGKNDPPQKLPLLHAILPDTPVGLPQVRRGESTLLVPAGVIGYW